MEIKAISNEDDYHRALRRVEELWHARHGSAEREELCALVPLVVSSLYEYYLSNSGSESAMRRTKKGRLLIELRESLEAARLRF
ncbi:MAG TPA: hypothetical protein VIY69_01245 [Candidatus Acidoferrales bacterium]